MVDPCGPIVSPPGEGELNRAFGLVRRFKVTAEQTGGALCVFEEEIPEGAGPPLHIHHREHELFAVLAGRVRFRCGETEIEAGPGATVLIPPGAPHAFRGLGPGTARVLITLTPGHGGDFFRAVEREGLSAPADMARITAIAATYGLSFVGPPLD